MDNNTAYGVSASPHLTNTTILQRWFDPGGAEQDFNAYQASITRAFNAEQSAIEREFNAKEAQKQRDYETEMSNTAYQRMVEDARKAGLNPYLAYQQGGASTPTGYAASAGSGARGSNASASAGRTGALGQLIGLGVQMASTAYMANLRYSSTDSYRRNGIGFGANI